MYLVSIIIPIYNKEEYLVESVSTVLRQTYTNIEVLLIDDGSTDNSGSLAKSLVKKDSRVKYFHHLNRGVAYSRNKGLSLAKGEYISFLDADDRWHPTFLEKMLGAIEKYNVCYSGQIHYINKKKQRPKMKFTEGDIFEDYIKNITTPNTNSWLIKKSYLQKFNIQFPLDLNWGEDMTFFSKILLHDKKIQVVSEYLTEYHMGNENNLSENNINKIQKDLLWMNEIKTYIFLYEENKRRKEKLINAFDSYRIPAAIVYRLWNNRDQVTYSDYIKYTKYLRKINLSNKLRSLKLIFYSYRLKNLLKSSK